MKFHKQDYIDTLIKNFEIHNPILIPYFPTENATITSMSLRCDETKYIGLAALLIVPYLAKMALSGAVGAATGTAFTHQIIVIRFIDVNN